MAVATGTKSVISLGVIITPHACIPVFLTEPSSILARLTVSASKSSPSEILSSWFTFSRSSALNALLNCFSSYPKIFPSLDIVGINFAILSASNNGKSKTRAVSRIEDFAAIVP